MNRKLRQLEDDLLLVLNSSDVPIEAKRYVVLAVLNTTEKEADKAILTELQTIVENGELEDAEST